ncbi:hypothetical protein ACFV13_16835 [Streptomyces bauhiniae]|uniref:hypothetical protein n=1 Tax=Streptomyces bauhiniae TaxID=2340725 RepID=UPI0036A01A64
MTKRLISVYAAILLPLSLAASLPIDAITYPTTALWTLAAMPSSIALTLHFTASALNVGGCCS